LFGKRRIQELEDELHFLQRKNKELENTISGEEFKEKFKKQVEEISKQKQRHLKNLALASGESWRATLHVNKKTFQSYIVGADGYDARNGYMEPPKWYGFGISVDESIKDGKYKVTGEFEEVGEPCLYCKSLIEKPRWNGYPSDNPKFCNKRCFERYTSV
jgi:TolA-binding protein